MPRPIFIITMPSNTAMETMKRLNERLHISIGMDYHVFLISGKVEKPEFKMFSDKEIEPIELERLKELIQ